MSNQHNIVQALLWVATINFSDISDEKEEKQVLCRKTWLPEVEEQDTTFNLWEIMPLHNPLEGTCM